MKKKTMTMLITVLLVVAVIAGVGAYAASNYGTADDPLVTMSYITDTLTPELESLFNDKVNAAVEKLENSFVAATQQTSDSYKLVTLGNGQKIVGSVGCEMLLRIGTAKCAAASSPGLVDTTTASSIDNGNDLTANHLYMVTIEGNGITATSSVVKILVRGTYTVS